jgi:hypothetical protein
VIIFISTLHDDHPAQERNKAVFICIVGKDFETFNTAADDARLRQNFIYVCFPGHTGIIA